MSNSLSAPFLNSIRHTLTTARSQAQQSINQIMVQAYWQIGQLIVEEEQKGSDAPPTDKA